MSPRSMAATPLGMSSSRISFTVEPLVGEVAEGVGEMYRAEADPDRIHAGDRVGLADRRERRRRDGRRGQKGEREAEAGCERLAQ